MPIVGAGSVGYFGIRLAGLGRYVTFLVRARRAAQLAAGVTLASWTPLLAKWVRESGEYEQ